MATFDDPRLTTIGLFIEAGTALQRRIGQVAGRHGLDAVDVDTLLRLVRSSGGRLRMADMIVQSGRNTQDASGQIVGLEVRGFARITTDPTDGQPIAAITPEGAIALNEAIADILAFVDDQVIPALGPDAPAVEAALRRLRDQIHPAATADGR